jgi:hypothetical protein
METNFIVRAPGVARQLGAGLSCDVELCGLWFVFQVVFVCFLPSPFGCSVRSI